MRQKHLTAIAALLIWLVLLFVAIERTHYKVQLKKELAVAKQAEASKEKKVVIKEKSKAEKQAVMKADLSTMDALGLYYDYANMSLVEVVEAYLAEFGIDKSQVAFSYKNPETGEVIGFNDNQPMTAGSTYKLPLNMLVMDGVADGTFSMDKAYDITEIDFEYIGEYEAYRGQFGDDMTIPEMQEYSLRYSENTPAYAMAEMLGGFEAAFAQLDRYGEAAGDIKTISYKGNKTTTDYYIQVMDYLYQHRDRYQDILYYLGISFPGDFAKMFLPHVEIFQKPGYYAEALNVDAIVMEETPYLVAIYTAYLGDARPDNDEISYEGVLQVGQLTYVINQWHRVNRN